MFQMVSQEFLEDDIVWSGIYVWVDKNAVALDFMRNFSVLSFSYKNQEVNLKMEIQMPLSFLYNF